MAQNEGPRGQRHLAASARPSSTRSRSRAGPPDAIASARSSSRTSAASASDTAAAASPGNANSRPGNTLLTLDDHLR